MNYIKFNQSGGFPFDSNMAEKMQANYGLLNALGYICGNLTIISGCEVVETTAANGVVFVDGEVLPFVGGTVTDNVKIVEAVTALEFEDLNTRDVIYTRHVTFGIATVQWAWADFKRGFPTKEIPAALAEKVSNASLVSALARITELEKKNAVFQAGGGMILWNKPAIDIPDGWHEVVNWRGRMPVGWNPDDASFDTVSEVGGSKTASISVPLTGYVPDENTSGGTSGTLIVSTGTTEAGENLESIKKAGTAPTGASTNIMNPYRIVIFIEYIQP